MSDNLETINQRVAISRKLAGFNQQDAAEKLGMKCSTYSQMERRGNISGERLVQIAKIFNVSITYLLLGEETNTLHTTIEPPVPEPQRPQMLLTRREENIITIIRNLSKERREELIKYIQDNYYLK